MNFDTFYFQISLVRLSPIVTLIMITSPKLRFSVCDYGGLSPPQQVAHSTCGDGEYNLRSRTVVCGSCGLPSDKAGSCSVTSASQSFRSGGLSEGLLPQSYVFSTSTPHKVGTALQLMDDFLRAIQASRKGFLLSEKTMCSNPGFLSLSF